MARADHFFVWRQHRGIPFQHHAIDMGDGTAVHFSDGGDGVAGPGTAAEEFVIQRSSIGSITRNRRDSIHVVRHSDAFDADTIVNRAASQVGRRGYHLLFDNCEHFACWCVRDCEESRQVSVACERLSAACLKTMAATSFKAASRVSAKRFVMSLNPWLLLADAAQWTTELGGHHVGMRDPQQRRLAGRAIGGLATLGIGALGGPVGAAVAGSIWVAGELAGEASRVAYDRVRVRTVDGKRLETDD